MFYSGKSFLVIEMDAETSEMTYFFFSGSELFKSLEYEGIHKQKTERERLAYLRNNPRKVSDDTRYTLQQKRKSIKE